MQEAGRYPTFPDDLEALLAKAFPHARDDVRSVLLETADLRRVDAGLTVTHQGDLADVLLVTHGHVGLLRTMPDGRQIMPRILTTGELVSLSWGERAPPAGSISLTSCEVAAWNPADVRSLAGSDDGFAMDLVDHVLDAFETVVTSLDGLLRQDAALRVARVLHHHQTLFFGEPPVLSRAHLPAMVGTSREMTMRVFRVLESRDIVARTPRGGLVLCDAQALEAATVAR